LPPLGGLLLPPLKGPPPLLLIGTFHPPVGYLLVILIKDGLPLQSWYDFLVGMICCILGLCFFSKYCSSSFEGSPQFVTILAYIIYEIGFGDAMGLTKGLDIGGHIVGTLFTPQ
jgi:hypothetical protein